ncbi:MAG: amidohydrolase family protein [Thermomicrobia bacterium]|nr:amidohydrolase family protein [Thermomicrobia bacterium]MCA1723524.1 amidohydrolase family protein [Thermomicrobia bacterium]
MDEGLREGIGRVTFVDHHVHAPEKRASAIPLDDFRRPFTEASIPAVWTENVQTLIGYQWMVRELARLLHCAPTEEAVLAARNAMAVVPYHRLLADAANLGACYDDDLFGFGQCYSIDVWAEVIQRPVERVLRVETFVEQGYAACETLDDALQRLTQEITTPARRLVSLKSIAGYRTGLAFDPPSAAQRRAAATAYQELRNAALHGESGRIAEKALVDTIVWTALEAAIPQRLPMQFHVAFGDDDIVMTKNDPTLMRALFAHAPFRVVPLVLLHCYPFHRQAGYLAGTYPNVYADLGLTIPIVGPGAAAVLAETLELCPTRQLLASTDGHMEPEFQWFSIHVWRWALARVLGQYIAWDILDGDTALDTAHAILHDNALRVYQTT